jgi:hypothetical protein
MRLLVEKISPEDKKSRAIRIPLADWLPSAIRHFVKGTQLDTPKRL